MRLKFLLLSGFFYCATVTPAQFSATLDINDIHAAFLTDGRIGFDPTTGLPRFEVPAGSGIHSLFAAAPWIGGLDNANQLHLAAVRFGQVGVEYWPGPLGTGAATTPAEAALWDEIFIISRAEVNAFIAGGPVTPNILNWPAHGDVTLGQDFNLAPFVDVDQDGIYDPSNGDYPCFPGDKALFFIFNDARLHGESGGAELGVEFRVMVYGFASGNQSLDQTLFMHYTIKNQSSLTYTDTYFGMFADFDLGNFLDDYIGSDVDRGLMYIFNGDNDDEDSFSPGYGTQPPAFGIAQLQGPLLDANGLDDPSVNQFPAHTGVYFGDGIVDNERLGMSSFKNFNNNGTVTGDPQNPLHSYDYMRMKWKDGSDVFYGGNGHWGGGADSTVPARFLYPGASDPTGSSTGGLVQAPWSEFSANFGPDDQRGVCATGPFTLGAGEYIGLDFAFIFARAPSGGPNASVTALQLRTDSIRDFFFNNGIYSGAVGNGCATIGSVGLNEEALLENPMELFPIPANEEITVVLKDAPDLNYKATIFDLSGKRISTHPLKKGRAQISIADLQQGVYMLSIPSQRGRLVKRFVKQ